MQKIFLTIVSLVFLIGAGCSSTQQPTTEPTDTTDNQTTLTPLQQAYANCLEQGYKTTLRFDETKSKLTLFCVFSEEKACDALKFLDGSCTLEKKENTSNTPPNDIKTIDDIENEISSTKACEQTVAPVCGLDGFTYTNQCIAESQRVQINHDGACKDVQQLLDADIPSPPPKTDTTATNTSNTKTDVIASGKPLDLSWLEHVKRFAKKEQSIIPVTIQECRIGGKYLYYKTGDFSVLYDHESELVCFPNNDLGDFCPSYFTKDNIIKGCTTIWQK